MYAYEACDEDGHVRLRDHYREDQYPTACRRADTLGGYVRKTQGWGTVYHSRSYLKKHPLGGGGGEGGMSRVNPPDSLWWSDPRDGAITAQPEAFR